MAPAIRRATVPVHMGGATEREPAGRGALRCARCGEVIGVYEPLIHVADGIARRSSRAAEPDLVLAGQGTCYHLSCSELDGAGPGAVE